jgi:hypothetical protein
MHVLPQGFHRIRYYGLLTSPTHEISQPSPKSRSPVCSLLSWPRLPSLR